MQMRGWIGVVCALAAGLAIAVPSSRAGASDALVGATVWQAKVLGCRLIDGQLVCGKSNNNADTGNQGTTAKKGTKGGGKQGERACPPGYVVLAEKNKYGAFCEPKEGLPAPAPAQAEACKFGMIGTPPNDCHCPAGQDFQGYKGCVAPAKIGYECDADVSPVNVGHSYYTMPPPITEQEARAKFAKNAKDSGYVITGPVTCKPVTYG